MSAIEITNTRNQVRFHLEKYAHLRDNDQQLISAIWKLELLKDEVNPKHLTSQEFLDKFANGDFTNPESIRRTRQKLQEKYPSLRGELYDIRHDNQDNIKDQLNLF